MTAVALEESGEKAILWELATSCFAGALETVYCGLPTLMSEPSGAW
jgi:hypothetical protein